MVDSTIVSLRVTRIICKVGAKLMIFQALVCLVFIPFATGAARHFRNCLAILLRDIMSREVERECADQESCGSRSVPNNDLVYKGLCRDFGRKVVMGSKASSCLSKCSENPLFDSNFLSTDFAGQHH